MIMLLVGASSGLRGLKNYLLGLVISVLTLNSTSFSILLEEVLSVEAGDLFLRTERTISYATHLHRFFGEPTEPSSVFGSNILGFF